MKKINLRIVDIQRFNEDTEKSSRLVDELSAAALGLVNGGPHAYAQFMQVRDEFKEHIVGVAKTYKTVEIE